jgi:hypothetical protein
MLRLESMMTKKPKARPQPQLDKTTLLDKIREVKRTTRRTKRRVAKSKPQIKTISARIS